MSDKKLLHALMLIDVLSTLGFKIYEKIDKLKNDPGSVTKEEVDALIAVAQPMIDEVADKVENL